MNDSSARTYRKPSLRHIVKARRCIEVDWLMSASVPRDLVPDVGDPAVELALMIVDG